MSILKQAAIALRDFCLAGLHGACCLRELCLLGGGIGIATVGASRAVRFETAGLTATVWPGAAEQAKPTPPIYHVELQNDAKTAGIRRGSFSLARIRLDDAAILERIPVSGSGVIASSHSRDGRVHALSTVTGGVTVVCDGKVWSTAPIELGVSRSSGWPSAPTAHELPSSTPTANSSSGN